MDISTMIVDLLRKSEEEKILNAGGPLAKAAPSTASAGAEVLTSPAYALYKKEALANGEPVMAPAEFKQAQSEGRY